ncbi:MAG: hypothetical protein AB7W59_19275 [Acidimicrobiia bacterium]
MTTPTTPTTPTTTIRTDEIATHNIPTGTIPTDDIPTGRTGAVTPASAAEHRPARWLRCVLAVNAATSAVTGALALSAGRATADALGTGAVTVVRVLGAGLLLFALDVALLASGRLRRPTLAHGALAVAALDAAWVAGSIAVVLGAELSGTGRAVVAVQAIGVADFAALQVVLARRIRRGDAGADHPRAAVRTAG